LPRKFRVEHDDRNLFEWPQSEAPLRAFPGLSEHRAPLGRLDLLAAMAINIRPLTGARPSLSGP
jgi:hypothetical protein